MRTFCPMCGHRSEKGKTLCAPCRKGFQLLSQDKKWIKKNRKTWEESLARIKRGPILRNPECEYCRLLSGVHQRARGLKEMRRAKARIKLHIKQVHTNPPSRRKLYYLKLAGRMAYAIYKHYRDTGEKIRLPARTPAVVKKYIGIILDANGIKWSAAVA